MPKKQFRNCYLDPCAKPPPEINEAMKTAPRECRRCGCTKDLAFDAGELAYECLDCIVAHTRTREPQGEADSDR